MPQSSIVIWWIWSELDVVPQHVKKSINMSNMPLNLHLKFSIHVGGFQSFFTTFLTIIHRQFSIAVFTFEHQHQNRNECIWADLKTRPPSSNIDLHLLETLFKPTLEGKEQEHPRKYSNLTQLRDQLFQSQGLRSFAPVFFGSSVGEETISETFQPRCTCASANHAPSNKSSALRPWSWRRNGRSESLKPTMFVNGEKSTDYF